MLQALASLAIALIAVLSGFGGIAAGAAGLAQLLFFALIAFLIIQFAIRVGGRHGSGGVPPRRPRRRHAIHHQHSTRLGR